MWSTYRLVPRGASEALDAERDLMVPTEQCKSFMHLHVGFDSSDLSPEIPPQWTVVQSWDVPIDSAANVIVVSCGSMMDPGLAPEGHHVIHAYCAGNEPYELWANLDRKRSAWWAPPSPPSVSCDATAALTDRPSPRGRGPSLEWSHLYPAFTAVATRRRRESACPRLRRAGRRRLTRSWAWVPSSASTRGCACPSRSLITRSWMCARRYAPES
ncbi:hypothetical protein T492DRAFT_897861 [Pavlovales sp. CCMP2436]|nr:hypothetical protein T492DRAFT_897861 [Pavlovales sp. CCMP2436]